MAQTVYKARFKQGTRGKLDQSIDELGAILEHLVGWGVRLDAISIDTVAETVTLTLSGPIPADQLAHVGLQVGP